MGTAKQLLQELEQELQKLQDVKKNIDRILHAVDWWGWQEEGGNG